MSTKWRIQCLLWGIVSACLTAYAVNVYWASEASWLWLAPTVVFVAGGSISTVTAFHLSTLRCSETHTLMTILAQYFLGQIMNLFTAKVESKLEKTWKEPRKAQETFLLKLIGRDVDTEYGQRYLRGIQSLQEFREKHPLTKYDHYEDYFQRLADGEKNVCVATKVDRFGLSSGTTGKGKLIPLMISPTGRLAATAVMKRLMNNSPVQKMGSTYCKTTHSFTKSGALVAAVSYVADSAGMRFMTRVLQNTPPDAFQISTDFEATYVHLLFTLTDRNICMYSVPFASQVYRVFSMLEENQDMFLEDLSSGRINPRLDIDAEIRRSLDAALKPNPARAEELRAEFAQGFVGIAGRIWPHLQCISTIDISGLMKKLEAKYAKGTKLYTAAYSCTECPMLGINLWMDGRPQQYIMLPSEAMVEFIPEDLSTEENPTTLLIDEVEVGKRYEVVVTSMAGFYRYRLGDVIEVVAFHENCPVIQVKYRTGELLNLRSEKVDKLVVANAIQESLASWPGATLVDWTCAESPLMYEDQEGVEYDLFYLLFVELDSAEDFRLTGEQKSLFDQSLRKQHVIYDNYRQSGTICEARVMIVCPGSFKKLQDFIIANSTATYNQFKMPKKLRTKATLDLMMECAVDV